MEKIKTIYDLEKEHSEWTNETFGYDRSPFGALSHMKEEIKEVEENPTDLEEQADVLLCYIDNLNCSGICMIDVIQAAFYKLKKNKKRKRIGPDKNGVFHHVKN